MGRLIDTSILIEAEKGRLNIESHLQKHLDDEFFLSVISVSELLHGVHRAKPSSVAIKRSAFVERTLARFPVLGVNVRVARQHARIWADLEESGRMIGQHDLWISATCVAHGLSIVTANTREFERVEGLVSEIWK